MESVPLLWVHNHSPIIVQIYMREVYYVLLEDPTSDSFVSVSFSNLVPNDPIYVEVQPDSLVVTVDEIPRAFVI